MFNDERFRCSFTRCKHDKDAVLGLLRTNDSEQGSSASGRYSSSWVVRGLSIDPSLTRTPIGERGDCGENTKTEE